jgi:hypothetical protein
LVLLGAIGLYAFLLASGSAPNPFPGIWEWLGRERPLAPDLVWQERLPSRPDSAAVVGDTVTVNAGERAEMRDRDTGELMSPGDPPGWPADWVTVAGGGDDVVVITSEDSHGYQVRDAVDGQVLHEDEEAVAVWAYQDARLDLWCDERRACRLRSYQPRASTPDWSLDLPGRRVVTLGANPELAGARTPDPDRIDPAVAGPVPIPGILGIPVERRGGDAVVVVQTATGQVLQVLEPGDDEKIMVVGDRVIRSTLTERNGICVSSVSGHDPVTGAAVWGPEPYHVWSSPACEQRNPPLGAGAALSVVRPDGQPIVIDAYDGRVLWSGEADESVAALSPDLAVIRAADQTTYYAVTLGDASGRRWEQKAEPDAEVLIARCGVVVSDRDPSRIYVWDAATGETRLSVPTTATVLACGPDGVVLAGGRSVGFAAFDGTGGDADPDPDRDPGRDTEPPPLDSK